MWTWGVEANLRRAQEGGSLIIKLLKPRGAHSSVVRNNKKHKARPNWSPKRTKALAMLNIWKSKFKWNLKLKKHAYVKKWKVQELRSSSTTNHLSGDCFQQRWSSKIEKYNHHLNHIYKPNMNSDSILQDSPSATQIKDKGSRTLTSLHKIK